MSEDAERIAVIWSPEARADLRAIDRETAMQILQCIDRYLTTRTGDVKKLKPPRTDFRLRCGDHRVFFDFHNEVSPAGEKQNSSVLRGFPIEVLDHNSLHGHVSLHYVDTLFC